MHIVVFPGMVLPLRVEEESQRQMIEDCQEGDKTFGAALIRAVRGEGELVPHAIGTTAEIQKVEKTEEEAVHVVAVGRSRYRLVAVEQHAPYLTGRVELLPRDESKAADMEPLIAENWRLFQRHMELLFTAASREPPELQMPQDPELLSFLMAANARMFPDKKQLLLETETAEERLQALRQMLKVENDTLKAILATMGPAIPPEEESTSPDDE
jgi:Lon protease-like protein